MFGSENPNTKISRHWHSVIFFEYIVISIIKEIPNGFLGLDTLIQTLRMLGDLRKTNPRRTVVASN